MMKNMKEIKRGIRKSYGRKGLKFANDVTNGVLQPNALFTLISAFKHGFEMSRIKAEEKQDAKDRAECIEAFKGSAEALCVFTYGALVIHGDIEPESERCNEIKTLVLQELDKVYDEIDKGKFNFVYDIDVDESGSPATMFINMIMHRMIIAGRLTPEEVDVYMEMRNKLSRN